MQLFANYGSTRTLSYLTSSSDLVCRYRQPRFPFAEHDATNRACNIVSNQELNISTKTESVLYSGRVIPSLGLNRGKARVAIETTSIQPVSTPNFKETSRLLSLPASLSLFPLSSFERKDGPSMKFGGVTCHWWRVTLEVGKFEALNRTNTLNGAKVEENCLVSSGELMAAKL